MRQVAFELTKDASRCAGDRRVVTHHCVNARVRRRTRRQGRHRTGGVRPAEHALDGDAQRRGDRRLAATLVGERERDEDTGE